MTPLDFLEASAPAALLPSRIQMAFTLAYHIIMVPLGVAFRLLTAVCDDRGAGGPRRRRSDVASRIPLVPGDHRGGRRIVRVCLGSRPGALRPARTSDHPAGAPAIEALLLVITAVALALVIPSLFLLYTLDQRSALES